MRGITTHVEAMQAWDEVVLRPEVVLVAGENPWWKRLFFRVVLPLIHAFRPTF